MKCGLLGQKLSHSYSPQIHAMLGDYTYELFEYEIEQIEDFLKNGNWDGINVTVPYKKDVIPYLDELTPIASKLGAVNTVVRRNGKLLGHNTDHYGFHTMMKASRLQVSGKKVLVLGSGGASNTAVAVLNELGADTVVISRSGENNYNNLHLHRDAAVIVNTTPVGMFPHNGERPVNLDLFPQLEGVLDVIYNPARTKLLLDAEQRGLVSMNGLLMLIAQAKEAAEWFTGKSIPDCVVEKIHRAMRMNMENIILIGMPGCGKTTVGQQLALRTGRKFADSDEAIVRLAGKPIPEIFEQDGEEVFRNYETKALEDLGKQSGLVIATGGGCVTKQQNYPLLHQNGAIFYLRREIHKLPVAGRPLSLANSPEAIYETRKSMYEAFADHIIDNNGSISDTVEKILEVLP